MTNEDGRVLEKARLKDRSSFRERGGLSMETALGQRIGSFWEKGSWEYLG